MNIQPIEMKRNAPAVTEGNDIWNAFRREIENVFERFGDGLGTWGPNVARLWARDGFVSLAMDVNEDDKAYTVTAELPGLDEKDVSVNVKGGSLIIEGEKRQQKEEKGKDRYLSERSYGAFKRSFALPDDVDANKVAAQFAKGVLTVTLPKTAEAQTARKIDIKAA